MTREEALYKLLRLEPAKKDELIEVTGWGINETEQTLQKLIADGRATFRNGGVGGIGRWYMANPNA